MNQGSAIVQADESDIDAAWLVIDRCRTALRDRGILQWDDVYPLRETVAEDIAQRRLYMLSDAGGCQAVVTVDAIQHPLYGTVAWQTAEPALVIHRLCVDPAWQGRGYARQLMEFAESYAARHRYASIRLDAYSANLPAVSMYRRRGYSEAGLMMFPRRSLPFYLFELAVNDVSHDPR